MIKGKKWSKATKTRFSAAMTKVPQPAARPASPAQMQRRAFQAIHDSVTVQGEEWAQAKTDSGAGRARAMRPSCRAGVEPKDKALLAALRDVQGLLPASVQPCHSVVARVTAQIQTAVHHRQHTPAAIEALVTRAVAALPADQACPPRCAPTTSPPFQTLPDDEAFAPLQPAAPRGAVIDASTPRTRGAGADDETRLQGVLALLQQQSKAGRP